MKLRTVFLSLLPIIAATNASALIYESLKDHKANMHTIFEVNVFHGETKVNIIREKMDLFAEYETKKTEQDKKDYLKKSMLLNCAILYVHEKQVHFNDVMKKYGHYSPSYLEPTELDDDLKYEVLELNKNDFVCADHEEEIGRIYRRNTPLEKPRLN